MPGVRRISDYPAHYLVVCGNSPILDNNDLSFIAERMEGNAVKLDCSRHPDKPMCICAAAVLAFIAKENR